MVKKRLGFSDDEFEALMTMPHHTHREFETYEATFKRLRWFFWLMYRLDRIPKSFYIKFAMPAAPPETGTAITTTVPVPVRMSEKDAVTKA
jgi:hypothetical protein